MKSKKQTKNKDTMKQTEKIDRNKQINEGTNKQTRGPGALTFCLVTCQFKECQ